MVCRRPDPVLGIRHAACARSRGGLFWGLVRVVGRLEAIVGVADRSFDDSALSWTGRLLGPSWIAWGA
eukprot:3479079-Pyramimonas_sp.AAC.1